MGVQSSRDGDSVLVLDDDRLPILIASWTGTATLKNVNRFYDWVEERVARAKATGGKLALINDALEAERPGAEVRQAFASRQIDAEVVISSPVVITSALVRGAMTAVGWLLGDRMKGVTSFATMGEALQSARRAFEDRGLKVDPSLFATYTRPTVSTSRASGA